MSAINKYLREFIRKRSNNVCERCGKREAEHMHHLTYERRHNELPEDIQHICIPCHKEYHPQHNFRCVDEQRLVAAAKRKRKDGIKPKNPWKILEMQAKRELRNAARFNDLPMARRRGI